VCQSEITTINIKIISDDGQNTINGKSMSDWHNTIIIKRTSYWHTAIITSVRQIYF
jgi:hypothetical protein